MAAPTHALLLPELLRTIFRHASPKDLILQQRTCRTWLKAIQESTPLQEKLCFKFFTAPEATPNESLQWNPFISKISSIPTFWDKIKSHVLSAISLEVEDLFKFDHPDASWKAMFLFNFMHPDTYVLVFPGYQGRCILKETVYKDLDLWNMNRFAETPRERLLKRNEPEDFITIVERKSVYKRRLLC